MDSRDGESLLCNSHAVILRAFHLPPGVLFSEIHRGIQRRRDRKCIPGRRCGCDVAANGSRVPDSWRTDNMFNLGQCQSWQCYPGFHDIGECEACAEHEHSVVPVPRPSSSTNCKLGIASGHHLTPGVLVRPCSPGMLIAHYA